MQSCGRKSPRLERVLFDLRTRSAWEMLCDTFSHEDDIAYLIRSTLIVAAADYSPARGQRKILSAKYSDISHRCTQLADDIESLLRLSEDGRFRGKAVVSMYGFRASGENVPRLRYLRALYGLLNLMKPTTALM